jgi:hypothetical protein
VLHHLSDLESDMLAIYGMRIEDMDSATFFRLAWRVSVYPGVMRSLRASQQDQASLPDDLVEIVKV